MSEQHIYEGEGSPYDLGIHAKAGSHYIDTAQPGHVWFSTFHDPNPEEPYTEWIKLEQVWPVNVSGGSWGMALPFEGRADGMMRGGGSVSFSGEGVIFSNVEMAVVEGDHVYSSVEPFMFSAVAGTEVGSVIFTVTPMFEYTQGAIEP